MSRAVSELSLQKYPGPSPKGLVHREQHRIYLTTPTPDLQNSSLLYILRGASATISFRVSRGEKGSPFLFVCSWNLSWVYLMRGLCCHLPGRFHSCGRVGSLTSSREGTRTARCCPSAWPQPWHHTGSGGAPPPLCQAASWSWTNPIVLICFPACEKTRWPRSVLGQFRLLWMCNFNSRNVLVIPISLFSHQSLFRKVVSLNPCLCSHWMQTDFQTQFS